MAFEISAWSSQLFKPWEANPRSYATKNGSAYRSRHKEKKLKHCCSLREQFKCTSGFSSNFHGF